MPAAERGIVGGSVAHEQYPFMAAVYMDNNQFCGGTLIHKDWVVTAGHCVEESNARGLSVVLGRSDLRTNVGERIYVKNVFLHPLYGLHNDIALLQLASSSSYQPATISDEVPREGTLIKAIGWGAASYQGQSSSALMEVDLPIINQNKCKKLYENLDFTEMCAGYLGAERGLCNGDSGGPLFTISNGRFALVGIVSYGHQCQDYTVFTRASSHREWLSQYAKLDEGNGSSDEDDNPDGEDTSGENNTTGGGISTDQGADSCQDQFEECSKWAEAGICSKVAWRPWMEANCCSSCEKVSSGEDSEAVCRDQFEECSKWAEAGICSKVAWRPWMEANCCTSCEKASVEEDSAVVCQDQFEECSKWALDGICSKVAWRPWMQANCCSSCQSSADVECRPAKSSCDLDAECCSKKCRKNECR